MDTNADKIFVAAKKASLSGNEKAQILAAIHAHVASHPARVPSSYFTRFSILRVSLASLLVILTGGTTAFAAAGTLPGDTLYPVKIHLNEKMESLLAVTSSARAEAAVTQALRRVHEAEELASRGRLDEIRAKEVEENFSDKTAELVVQVKKLKENHDDEAVERVHARFKGELDTHFETFVQLEENATATKQEIQNFKESIRKHLNQESEEHERKNERSREKIEATQNTNDRSSLEDRTQEGREKIKTVVLIGVA